MSLKLKLSPLAAAAALACVSLSAHATNGYFLPGFGVQSMSMGGTGIASGTDSLSAGANPANLSWVGTRGDLDLILFNPNRYAKTDFGAQFGGTPGSPTTYVESDDKLFEFPNLGFSMSLTDRLAVGVAFLANGGMNTTYRQNFYGYNALVSSGAAPVNSTIGVDLMQLLIPLSVSFKPTDNQSVGFSLIPALQRFRARGLQTFTVFNITSDKNHMTNQGAQLSYGFGARIGWIGHFVNNKVDLGLTYATKIYMSKIGGYKGLFAESGSFDIPANYGVGLALHPNEQWTLAFDITRIMYNQVPAVANRGPGLTTQQPNPFTVGGTCPSGTFCLGQPLGMGFGWQDQTVYKFGLAYKLNQQWTLKAGYNYAHSPIPNDQITFNTLAPATVERHYSAGFTWKSPTSPLEVSGFYMRVPNHEQCGTNLSVVGSACIKMDQNYLGVSLGWDLGGGS